MRDWIAAGEKIMSDNHRKFPRFDTEIKVVVVDEDNHQHTGSVTNVSAGGAVVQFDLGVEIDPALMSIGGAIQMNASNSPKVPGRIIRGGDEGIAMQFNSASDDVFDWITKVVDEAEKRRR